MRNFQESPPVILPADLTPVSLGRFVLYFLKLGTIGFGGPIALVGHMQRDVVEQQKWIAAQDFLDGLAFSQLAPGPLAAQLAMYLGFAHSGAWGATSAAPSCENPYVFR